MPRLAVTATAFMAIAVALSAAPGAAQDAQPDDPIAVVNGEAITVGDLNDFYDTVTANAPQRPPLDQRAYDGLRDAAAQRAFIDDLMAQQATVGSARTWPAEYARKCHRHGTPPPFTIETP